MRFPRFLFLLALLARPLSGQGGPAGALSGRVADEAGGALPGVSVEVRVRDDARPARLATTDASGEYRLDGLTPGPYEVTFRLASFADVVLRGVAVIAGDVARSDATMRLSVSDEVLVTARRTLRSLSAASEPGESLVGIADAASQGTVVAEQIALRPIARAGDVLETIPGVVVSQHSGEGKANQYYLRGFNLDHGTDFATTLAGMPVNLPTHAHGQGYTDVSFVIPELVGGIQYRKGPYFAEDGDFTAAGSASIQYVDALAETIVRADGGSFGFARGLLAGSPRLGDGRLLYALEGVHDDGPWDHGDGFR
jgi:hypothetical protein